MAHYVLSVWLIKDESYMQGNHLIAANKNYLKEISFQAPNHDKAIDLAIEKLGEHKNFRYTDVIFAMLQRGVKRVDDVCNFLPTASMMAPLRIIDNRYPEQH